jgi:hypothetical protein
MKLSHLRSGVKVLGALGAGFALLLAAAIANAAAAESRVALVIGNSAYTGDLPALANPSNDAKLMVNALRSVGFEVVTATDANKEQMIAAIGEFRDKLLASGSQSTGLFFYAGHGLQVAGENYLIPVDAKIKAEKDVELASISADTVMKQMEFAEPAVKIIILDACRNNPLGDGARSMSRGLAKIETATTGTFIAYSTAPGKTAADGDGVNSPYTKALAETIAEPGLSIADVFQEVRTKVLASTGNEQTPWDSSSLTGRFYFRAPDPNQAAGVTPPPAAPTTSAAEEALKTEKTYWDSVKDSGDPDAIQLYLKKYPNGYFVDLANAKLGELKGGTKFASADAAEARNAPTQQTVVKPAAAPAMSFIVQSQTVYAKDGGQVRAQPNAKAALLSKLKNNTEVNATGISTDGKWWRVALADGQTGYMHASVVTEQPVQTAAAAPSQSQTLGVDALEVAASQPQPQPQGDVGSQIFQGLAAQAAQQLGLPVTIPQGNQPARQQASTLSFDEIYETIEVRAGAQIFNAAGGQPIYNLRQGGPLLATARSSDGRWFKVSLPNGQQGYVPRQSVRN